MYRFVYCPLDSSVEDAYELAKEWRLPIQHGDSERSQDYEFDRNTIGVVTIPTDVGFSRNGVKLYVNEPIAVHYVDDWNDISNYSFVLRPLGLVVGKQAWDVPVMKLDEHTMAMNIALTFPGMYELVSLFNSLEVGKIPIEIVGSEDGE